MPAAAHRTLAVLAALTAAPGPRTLAQLTADTGVPRVSLVRLLAALEEEGGVVTDAAGRYSPSLLPWTIAAGTVSRGGVRDVAFPYLADLAHRVPANVNLCLPTFPQGIVVESLTAVGGRLTSRLVESGPFHLLATAVGRVIAAFETAENREAVLRMPLPAATPFTRNDPATLAGELALVRERGYATIDREHVESVSGFAVPLFRAGGTPAGAIGFARPGPLDEEFVQQHVTVARESADRISWELGWRSGQAARLS